MFGPFAGDFHHFDLFGNLFWPFAPILDYFWPLLGDFHNFGLFGSLSLAPFTHFRLFLTTFGAMFAILGCLGRLFWSSSAIFDKFRPFLRRFSPFWAAWGPVLAKLSHFGQFLTIVWANFTTVGCLGALFLACSSIFDIFRPCSHHFRPFLAIFGKFDRSRTMLQPCTIFSHC